MRPFDQDLAAARVALRNSVVGVPDPRRCATCRRPFRQGDTIVRLREGSNRGPRMQAVCTDCAPWVRDAEPTPCLGCGRPVIREAEWDRADPGEPPRRSRWATPRLPLCGPKCAERHHNATRAVEHEPRPCEQCGETFTPRRADARFCGKVCKQRAYRARKAAERDEPA